MTRAHARVMATSDGGWDSCLCGPGGLLALLKLLGARLGGELAGHVARRDGGCRRIERGSALSGG